MDGVTILQVDDSFGHGFKTFLQDEEEQSKLFECKPRVAFSKGNEIKFNGTVIKKTHNAVLAV